jgi:hypothetical protein
MMPSQCVTISSVSVYFKRGKDSFAHSACHGNANVLNSQKSSDKTMCKAQKARGQKVLGFHSAILQTKRAQVSKEASRRRGGIDWPQEEKEEGRKGFSGPGKSPGNKTLRGQSLRTAGELVSCSVGTGEG